MAAQRPEIPLALDLYLPVPEDNPLTPQKVALGRRLFFDPILSCDYSLACASCHDPRRTFTDGLRVAIGVSSRQGSRNAPTLVNRGYGAAQFWDGWASSLEEQALQPIENANEFDMTVEGIIARLKNHSDYPALFQEVFGCLVNAEDLARARSRSSKSGKKNGRATKSVCIDSGCVGYWILNVLRGPVKLLGGISAR